ncbi:MAG: hypothetical protein ACYDBH_12275 [Acidobacteriaceae bacterium]
MPFIFVIIGIYAVAVALHGQTGNLASELVTTTSGFVVWAVAVAILAVFATKGPEDSRKVGMAFLILAAIGFVLANGKGLFSESQKFVAFVQSKGNTSGSSGSTVAGG